MDCTAGPIGLAGAVSASRYPGAVASARTLGAVF